MYIGTFRRTIYVEPIELDPDEEQADVPSGPRLRPGESSGTRSAVSPVEAARTRA